MYSMGTSVRSGMTTELAASAIPRYVGCWKCLSSEFFLCVAAVVVVKLTAGSLQRPSSVDKLRKRRGKIRRDILALSPVTLHELYLYGCM
jgi:hypothetical protein